MNKTIIFGIMLLLVTLQLIFLADALLVKSVGSFPFEIKPGESAELSIEIENDGDYTLEDVSVSLMFSEPTLGFDLPFAPYQSSSEKSIDELEDGDEKTFRFKIQALSDAEPGVYRIPIMISYKEDDETKTKTSLISLVVNSEPILDIEEPDGLFLKGQTNEVSIRVVNKGLADVKFLTIKLRASTNYNLVSADSVYIGNLDSDDFDSADFRIYFKETSPTIISLPVSIEYRDALNNEYNENVYIDIKVYSEAQALKMGLIKKSNTGIYAGVVIALLVIWFIYRSWKKRRKKKLAVNK